VPSVDNGSAWVTNKRGENPPSGLVSFWVEPATELGWRDLRVHSA
jgi:hypothetical protein